MFSTSRDQPPFSPAEAFYIYAVIKWPAKPDSSAGQMPDCARKVMRKNGILLAQVPVFAGPIGAMCSGPIFLSESHKELKICEKTVLSVVDRACQMIRCVALSHGARHHHAMRTDPLTVL